MSKSKLPYPTLSDVRIRNDEPLTYAYFNAHMLRLLADIRAINTSRTIQRATPTQWGVVRFASVDDVVDPDGDRNLVISNKTLNASIERMRSDNAKAYRDTNRIPMSKNYEWRHGEFTVGLGENVARKITDVPESVVYSNVYYIPSGFGETPIRTAATKTGTDPEFFRRGLSTVGRIEFGKVEMPPNYEEFHVYYHRAGYVICRNGKVVDGQRQINVAWNILVDLHR